MEALDPRAACEIGTSFSSARAHGMNGRATPGMQMARYAWTSQDAEVLDRAVRGGEPERRQRAATSGERRVVQQLATEQGGAGGPRWEVSCAHDRNDRRIVETGVASLGVEPHCGELQR
jgi:hypothetical protein